MAVLIEGYSVVINKASALKKPQALEALTSIESTLHPTAICSDEGLLRVGFLDLNAATEFITNLEAGGLIHKTHQKGEEVAGEVMMVTQFGEMDVTCPWLSVKFTKLKDNTLISVAALNTPEPTKGVAFPKGWAVEESLLKRYFDTRMSYMLENYDLISEEPMHNIFRSKTDGKELRLLRLTMKETDPAKLQ